MLFLHGLGNLGELQQSQEEARPPWMPMQMELLLSKVFLEPASPLEKHIFNQELPLLLLLLSTHPSSHSHFHSSLCLFLYFHAEVLVPSAGTRLSAPHKHLEFACSGTMQAHETAWKCECFSESREEATELKPGPDEIQGAFTVMKFFSKNCSLFGAAVIVFSVRASTSPGCICSDDRTEPKCLGRIC